MMIRKRHRLAKIFSRKKARSLNYRAKQHCLENIGLSEALPAVQVFSASQRWKIIAAYAETLEQHSSSLELDLHLPFSKSLISYAIYMELQENPDGEWNPQLAVAYVQLEAFVSAGEYRVVKQFKAACAEAEQMARSGDPADIIESARILRRVRGSRAVRIVTRVSDKMRKRFEQINTVGASIGWSDFRLCLV